MPLSLHAPACRPGTVPLSWPAVAAAGWTRRAAEPAPARARAKAGHPVTNAGLAAARARGRKGGRKAILTAKKLDASKVLLQDRNRSVGKVAKQLGVGRTTLYRALGGH
jgi:transcriptional regulator of acetoin/glycerol metabolism